MRRRSFIAGLSAVPLALKVNTLHACSLVFVNDRKIAKIVVRSMDLPVSFPERPKLFVFPRGMARTSTSSVVPGIRARIEGIGSNTVHWRNRFGSVAMVGFDGAATDGLNEKGLCRARACAHFIAAGTGRRTPRAAGYALGAIRPGQLRDCQRGRRCPQSRPFPRGRGVVERPWLHQASRYSPRRRGHVG